MTAINFLVSLVVLLCFVDYFTFSFQFCNYKYHKSSNLFVNDDSFDWNDIPDFSSNIPTSKKLKNEPKTLGQSINKPLKTNSAVFKPLQSPNPDWRSTLTKPNGINIGKSAAKKPPKVSTTDAFSTELDYEDFELAMMEEENYGMNPTGGGTKISAIIDNSGIDSGEVIPKKLFELLVDSENLPFKHDKLNKGIDADVAVIYADPRRMTDDYKIILSEFNKLPKSSLKLNTIAVNCDDSNDLRKYLKKSSINFPILCDPTKQLMDFLKCRANKRLSSALLFVEISTGIILKIFYENDWDPYTTKDLIVEEVKQYRLNPKEYMESQIGIR